jgi:phosphatidylglycerophosphate synthase
MVNKIDERYECPFDIYLLKFIDTHLDYYYKLGFTPNMITTIGIIIGTMSAYNILKSNYKTAAFLLLLAYYFDCVDGKLARKYKMITKFGDYYDHIGDIYKIIIIVYALYKTNKNKFNKIKFFLIIIIFLTIMHLGNQEIIYDSDESPVLSTLKNNISKENAIKNIKYTRYFGCGTLMIILAIIVLLWQ